MHKAPAGVGLQPPADLDQADRAGTERL